MTEMDVTHQILLRLGHILLWGVPYAVLLAAGIALLWRSRA